METLLIGLIVGVVLFIVVVRGYAKYKPKDKSSINGGSETGGFLNDRRSRQERRYTTTTDDFNPERP